jgi:hypothetical protein
LQVYLLSSSDYLHTLFCQGLCIGTLHCTKCATCTLKEN